MKRLLYILLFIPSLIFGQATVNLSPDSTLYDLHVLSTTAVSAYCDEYQAVYNALSAPGPYVNEANTLVDALVTAGYWAGFDFFYELGATAEADVLINWINPGTYNLSKNGTITHVPNVGVTSNGTTGYYNTGVNFSAGGFNYVRDDAFVAVYILTNVQENTYEFGVNQTVDIFLATRNTSDVASCKMNDGSNLPGVASTDSRGLWWADRVGTAKKIHRNGSEFASQAIVSTGLPNGNFAVLSLDGGSLISTRQVGLIFAGKFSTMNVAAITTLIETYMDAKGIGVIP